MPKKNGKDSLTSNIPVVHGVYADKQHNVGKESY